MTTLFLICGLPGSGKTTLAKKLEVSERALRLCPDEWIAILLADPNDIPELDRLRSPIEAIQWETAKRALTLQVSVILEWGFWSRRERDYYRTEAEALGANLRLYYLDIEVEELWNRLEKRNSELLSGAFMVTKENLEKWSKFFELPVDEEL
ncbi:MAG: ATP-binding protein [Anaerolineales bacterium]|nr:ATP-binding protein [Anaerolineales bacterium]